MRKSLISLLLITASTGVAFADGMSDSAKQWRGAYVGAHLGYAWGDVDVTDTSGGVTPGPFSYSPDGVFGGVTAGYNFQAGCVVFGVEGDAGYMDLTGAGVIPSSNPIYHQDITLDGGFYALIAGRLGFAWDNNLLYAKAGWAYFDGEASQKTTKPGYETDPTGAFSGAVYGAGIEHFISPNVSMKVEYLHFDFGSEDGDQVSISDPPIGFVYTNTTDLTADSVKLGVTFHL